MRGVAAHGRAPLRDGVGYHEQVSPRLDGYGDAAERGTVYETLELVVPP